MQFRIITPDEGNIWEDAFAALPPVEQDPWFTPAWYRLWAAKEEATACAALFEEGAHFALYPFLKGAVPRTAIPAGHDTDYCDLRGAPGYNGIAANHDDPAFFAEATALFDRWCGENRILAEFSRCNPVTGNHRRFPSQHLAEVNLNVVVALQPGTEDYLHDGPVQKSTGRAVRAGLEVISVPGDAMDERLLEAFASMYRETMERTGADREYLYNAGFFTEVAATMGDRALFYFTLLGGEPVSAEIVLCGPRAAYSWLGCTRTEHFPLRPNELLKLRLMEHLAARGVYWYCIGGGMQPGDSLYQYKRSFARHGERPFHIYKRIHHHGPYQAIMSHWRRSNPHLVEKYGQRLLGYREGGE